MPRPRKLRNVCYLPKVNKFGPVDGFQKENYVIMTVDEYETIRLIDFEGYMQEECAKQMNIARTTVQGIYNDARKKIANALVNGKVLMIEGGDFQLCNQFEGRGRGCKRCCEKRINPKVQD